MHQTHHAGRRRARSKHLRNRFATEWPAYYIDASRASKRHMLAVTQQRVIPTTVLTRSTCVTEAAAIAMPIVDAEQRNGPTVILSDSQSARCLLHHVMVPRTVRRILGPALTEHRDLIWWPAHDDVKGNVSADRIARGFPKQAAAGPNTEFL